MHWLGQRSQYSAVTEGGGELFFWSEGKRFSVSLRSFIGSP